MAELGQTIWGFETYSKGGRLYGLGLVHGTVVGKKKGSLTLRSEGGYGEWEIPLERVLLEYEPDQEIVLRVKGGKVYVEGVPGAGGSDLGDAGEGEVGDGAGVDGAGDGAEGDSGERHLGQVSGSGPTPLDPGQAERHERHTQTGAVGVVGDGDRSDEVL